MTDWRPISGFPRYQVARDGRVRRADGGATFGWLLPVDRGRVALYIDGARHDRAVADLVKAAFALPAPGAVARGCAARVAPLAKSSRAYVASDLDAPMRLDLVERVLDRLVERAAQRSAVVAKHDRQSTRLTVHEPMVRAADDTSATRAAFDQFEVPIDEPGILPPVVADHVRAALAKHGLGLDVLADAVAREADGFDPLHRMLRGRQRIDRARWLAVRAFVRQLNELVAQSSPHEVAVPDLPRFDAELMIVVTQRAAQQTMLAP